MRENHVFPREKVALGSYSFWNGIRLSLYIPLHESFHSPPHSLSNSVLAVTKRTGASANISALRVWRGISRKFYEGCQICLLKSVWKRVPKLKILSMDSGFKIYFITMNFYIFFFLLKTAMELPSIHWSSNNPCVMCSWTKPFWTVSCCWTKLIWSPASEFYHSNKRSLIFQVLPCLRKISPFSLAGAWDRFV